MFHRAHSRGTLVFYFGHFEFKTFTTDTSICSFINLPLIWRRFLTVEKHSTFFHLSKGQHQKKFPTPFSAPFCIQNVGATLVIWFAF